MKIRKYVISAWKEYRIVNYDLPFKLWYLFTEKSKIEKRNYTALVRTFQRNKKRNRVIPKAIIELPKKAMKFQRNQYAICRIPKKFDRIP